HEQDHRLLGIAKSAQERAALECHLSKRPRSGCGERVEPEASRDDNALGQPPRRVFERTGKQCDPAEIVERFGSDRQVAASTRAVEEILTVSNGRRVIAASPCKPAERGERSLANLAISTAAQGECLLEAELGVGRVPGVERAGGDVDQQAGGGRTQLPALITGERLADVAHGVTTSPGVEL